MAPSPRSPRCSAHPGLGPATASLTNYGQGHLKTWPLQHRGCKGNRRQVGGHRDARWKQKVALKERLKATRAGRWPPGPRARWPPRTQRRRAEETGGKRRERRKKSCLLSRWCCEEGKEGHGQPGAVGVQRPGTAGAAEGRGRLPSPRAGHRRFPTAGKAQPEPRHAGAGAASPPRMLRGRGDPALKQLSLLPLSEAV